MDTPYRAAREEELALAELERHAADQFDPYLVRSFVSLVRVNQLTGKGPRIPSRTREAA